MLSDAGDAFLGYASKALREVDQGVRELQRPPDELVGEVRIGATHSFNVGFVPECLAAFMHKHPTVKTSVHELSADAIAQRLLADELDVGISYLPSAGTDLWFEPLYTEELVLVVSRSHPFAQRKRVRMVELHRHSMVLLPREFATRTLLDEAFRSCGADPVVVAEMNALAPMVGLVAKTQLAAIVAPSALQPGDAVCAIPLESPTPVRTPGLLWRRGVRQSEAVKSFGGNVRKLALQRSLQVGRRDA
jgi:LysR family cyn operon transcriptional activator